MTTLKHRVTAEELLAMPHDQPCELIAGEIVMMSPAGGEHCEVAARVHVLVGAHVMRYELGYTYISEPGFVIARNPDTVRAPDVAFVRADRASESPSFLSGAPDLAIEVVSPSDRPEEVDEKAHAWLDAGTAMVWVVSPDARNVTVYRPGCAIRVLREQDLITGEDVLPGFERPVADFFRSRK